MAGLESDAGSVEFVRRTDGRIVAARDDLGRAVGYGYDDRYSGPCGDSYASPGDYEIRSDVTCSPCQSVFVLGSATTTVSVTSGCTTADVDAVAAVELGTYGREPFERSFSIACNSGAAAVINRVVADPDVDSSADPCRAALYPSGVAGAHSHPEFTNASQMNNGKGCHGRKDWAQSDVAPTNSANYKHTSGDKAWAKTHGLPLYLVVPNRNWVQVYEKSDGSWGTRKL